MLSKADVVVVNGLGLEGWVDRLIKASGFKGELVVASTGVKTHTLNEEGKRLPILMRGTAPLTARFTRKIFSTA